MSILCRPQWVKLNLVPRLFVLVLWNALISHKSMIVALLSCQSFHALWVPVNCFSLWRHFSVLLFRFCNCWSQLAVALTTVSRRTIKVHSTQLWVKIIWRQRACWLKQVRHMLIVQKYQYTCTSVNENTEETIAIAPVAAKEFLWLAPAQWLLQIGDTKVL